LAYDFNEESMSTEFKVCVVNRSSSEAQFIV